MNWKLYVMKSQYYIQSEATQYSVQVLDAIGRQLESHPNRSGDFTLNLSYYPAGIYLLRLRCEGYGREVVLKVKR